MDREGLIWIGALEPYMTEKFLLNALSLMGEEDVVGIKFIKNKFTGERATYGFIQFETDAAALMAMHKLNGKIIPHSQPPVRFQLNHASAKTSGEAYSEREYSIWVAELPHNISEEEFRKLFSTRYASVKTSKLMHEKDGKTFGFVRFTDPNDQRESLIHMNGYNGLSHGKPMKVSMAVPRHSLTSNVSDSSTQYSHLYERYWSDRAAWTNYGAYQGGSARSAPVVVSGHVGDPSVDWDLLDVDENDDEAENRLIEYDTPVNVDAMNAEFIARSQEVWDDVDNDRWIYNLENDEGFVPNFKNSKRKV